MTSLYTDHQAAAAAAAVRSLKNKRGTIARMKAKAGAWTVGGLVAVALAVWYWSARNPGGLSDAEMAAWKADADRKFYRLNAESARDFINLYEYQATTRPLTPDEQNNLSVSRRALATAEAKLAEIPPPSGRR